MQTVRSSLERDATVAILDLLATRGDGTTICPSEAARRVGGAAWRDAMPAVHAAAQMLSHDGSVTLSQRGVVTALLPRGAYRIGRPSK